MTSPSRPGPHCSALRAPSTLLWLLRARGARPSPPRRSANRPPRHEASGEREPAHEQTLLQTVAKLANFAILAGVLVYFLRDADSVATCPRARRQIRQDLVTAAEMRKAATRAARRDRSQAEGAARRSSRRSSSRARRTSRPSRRGLRRPRPRIASGCSSRRAARSRCGCASRAASSSSHAAAARRRRRRSADPAIDHGRRSAAPGRPLHRAAPGGAMTSRAAGVRYARALFDVALKESDVAAGGARARGVRTARRGPRDARPRAGESRPSRRRRSAASSMRCCRAPASSPMSSPSCCGCSPIATGSSCCPRSSPPTGRG